MNQVERAGASAVPREGVLGVVLVQQRDHVQLGGSGGQVEGLAQRDALHDGVEDAFEGDGALGRVGYVAVQLPLARLHLEVCRADVAAQLQHVPRGAALHRQAAHGRVCARSVLVRESVDAGSHVERALQSRTAREETDVGHVCEPTRAVDVQHGAAVDDGGNGEGGRGVAEEGRACEERVRGDAVQAGGRLHERHSSMVFSTSTKKSCLFWRKEGFLSRRKCSWNIMRYSRLGEHCGLTSNWIIFITSDSYLLTSLGENSTRVATCFRNSSTYPT